MLYAVTTGNKAKDEHTPRLTTNQSLGGQTTIEHNTRIRTSTNPDPGQRTQGGPKHSAAQKTKGRYTAYPKDRTLNKLNVTIFEVGP